MNVFRKLIFGLAMALAILMAIVLPAILSWWLLLSFIVPLVAWMSLTRVGQQTWSVTRVGIATIPQRLGSSSVIVVGIAGVVGVFVALLAMGAGFESTLVQTGTDDAAIILEAGAQSEIRSVLERDTVALVMQAPQVLSNARGQPIASPELVEVVSLPKSNRKHEEVSVELRGVSGRAWELRPRVKITAGRKFKPGLRELLVGKGVHERISGVDIGSALNFNGQSWSVVGIFDSGDAHNSEIWGDTTTIGSAFHRGASTGSLIVRLTDAHAFDAFKAGLAGDPRLKVDVQTTRRYYNQQAEGLAHVIRILGTTVGAIMAVGAIMGALNTMYAAIETRAREIATLRAIGFRDVPVVVSVLLETMLLAVLGGVIGIAIAWAIFDGFTASTSGANFSQIVFAFNVSPALLWSGLKWALAIGFIGGLFPAVRAARVPIALGLREL